MCVNVKVNESTNEWYNYYIKGCPQAMHDLMLKCWAEEPNRRPTFGQIRADLEEFLRDPSLLNGNDGIFRYI